MMSDGLERRTGAAGASVWSLGRGTIALLLSISTRPMLGVASDERWNEWVQQSFRLVAQNTSHFVPHGPHELPRVGHEHMGSMRGFGSVLQRWIPAMRVRSIFRIQVRLCHEKGRTAHGRLMIGHDGWCKPRWQRHRRRREGPRKCSDMKSTQWCWDDGELFDWVPCSTTQRRYQETTSGTRRGFCSCSCRRREGTG